MNTHDDNDASPGDDELKALYRSLPRKEPSPAMDAVIKRAAADAVRAERSRRVTRWPVAIASSAVIVVAAGLSWRTMQQPSSVPQIPTAPAMVARSTASNEPVPPASAAAVADAVSANVAPQAAPQAVARMASPRSPKKENIGSAMKPKVVAPVIATNQPPAAATEPVPMVSEDSAAAMPQAAPTPALAVAPEPAPMPAPTPAAPPAPAAAVAEATAPAVAPMAASARGAVVAGLNQRASTTMKAMAVVAPMPALETTAFNPTDAPTQELAKIRRLFALQRHDEAMQRLAAFQQAHPDVPLPDDLRAQLPNHE